MTGTTISIIAFIKRKPGLTHAEFYDHWINVHAPLVRTWALKHGFLEYRQVHTDPALNDAPSVGNDNPGNDELGRWDGCALLEVPSMEAFVAAFQDPLFQDTIQKDEDLFVNKAAGVMRRIGGMNKII